MTQKSIMSQVDFKCMLAIKHAHLQFKMSIIFLRKGGSFGGAVVRFVTMRKENLKILSKF